MGKKSLIIYASMTGNTEKVARTFQHVFERNGWECDAVKIDDGIDPTNPPFNYAEYDFLCVGSPVIASLPVREMVDILWRNPASPHHGHPDMLGCTMPEILQKFKDHQRLLKIQPRPEVSAEPLIIRFGPEDKKGIVFVTFGGIHQGPKEAVPSLALLESEMEHLRFECVGRFACPGRFGTAQGWFKDLQKRPNERDLRKAEIFLKEILEEIRD